jgi:hypothetical protein
LKEIQLTRPSDYELDDAYRQLSKGGNILVEIDPCDLINTLSKLKGIGFVGIEMPYYMQEGKWITISGFKGKHGPCFNTGMKASYTGSALAAFDDDNHLLIKGKESAVCEKTGTIYRFSPYRGLIKISEGSQEFTEQLKSRPEKFDLYSLDDELNALYKHLKHNSGQQERVFAFYPGPFRSLILNDGTIIKRGEVNSIPESELEDLVKGDRFIKIKKDTDVDPVFFQEEYIRLGPRCLQMDQKVLDQGAMVRETDINELNFHSMKLFPRLMGLIDQDRNCFILTGSDPADEMGCCPSDEVGEANRLVEAGVLSAVSQEVYGDACPVSYYAFKDEIFVQDEDIQFKKNQELRKKVYLHLKKARPPKYKSVIRWILLGFVLVSLVFAVLKVTDKSGRREHYSLYEQLSISGDDVILILLFHNRVRCTMCLNMEQHIRSLMSEDYTELVEDKRILFILMDMNKAENKSLNERFRLYTASVVIVKMIDKEEVDSVILNDIWEHHKDGAVFREKITKELETLLRE